MVYREIIKSIIVFEWDDNRGWFTHLVRQGQGQLKGLGSIGVGTLGNACDGHRGAGSPHGRKTGASEAVEAHFARVDDVQRLDYPS